MELEVIESFYTWKKIVGPSEDYRYPGLFITDYTYISKYREIKYKRTYSI